MTGGIAVRDEILEAMRMDPESRQNTITVVHRGLNRQLGKMNEETFTFDVIGRLVDADLLCKVDTRKAFLEGKLHGLGLPEVCMKVFTERYHDKAEVWVQGTVKKHPIWVRCKNGLLDTEAMADMLGMDPHNMRIGNETITSSNFLSLVNGLQREDLKEEKDVVRGTVHWKPIDIIGTSITTTRLPYHQWLREPVTGQVPPAKRAKTSPSCKGKSYEVTAVQQWEEFTPGMETMTEGLKSRNAQLNQQWYRTRLPEVRLMADSEFELAGRLQYHILDHINAAAAALKLGVQYRLGGPGRSASFADIVLCYTGEGEGESMAPSKPVVGVGSVAMHLPDFGTSQEAVQDPAFHKQIKRLLGLAIMDEAPLLLLTNGTVTFVLVRDKDITNNTLKISPPIRLGNTMEVPPLAAFLYTAKHAAECMCPKQLNYALPALDSSHPPSDHSGSGLFAQRLDVVREPSQWLQAVKHGAEDALARLPVFTLQDLSYTGHCLTYSRHRRVFQAQYKAVDAVIKVYNARNSQAVEAFVREVCAYSQLPDMWGENVPGLLAVGRLYETDDWVLV